MSQPIGSGQSGPPDQPQVAGSDPADEATVALPGAVDRSGPSGGHGAVRVAGDGGDDMPTAQDLATARLDPATERLDGSTASAVRPSPTRPASGHDEIAWPVIPERARRGWVGPAAILLAGIALAVVILVARSLAH